MMMAMEELVKPMSGSRMNEMMRTTEATITVIAMKEETTERTGPERKRPMRSAWRPGEGGSIRAG